MEQPALGKKIAQLRKDLNLSQEEVTQRCHISVRTIQRIESGEVTPRGSTIRILLAALDFSYEDLKNEANQKDSSVKGLTGFFLLKSLPNHQILNVLQIAWIAGVVYFVIGFIEGGMDYLISTGEEFDETGKSFYGLIKGVVFISYLFFMRGFIALGQLFNNYLLRVAAYLLSVLALLIAAGDVFLLYTVEDWELYIPVYVGQSITFGAISILFGVALIRLQDGMGRLSGYAGVLEMVLGASFLIVIFFVLGFVLMIPANILEIVLLYKGYEFIKEETARKA